MRDEKIQTVELAVAGAMLAELYERVKSKLQRVGISKSGEAECVLISQEELDSLERAIEILSDSQDVRELARSLSKVAHASGGLAGLPVSG